LRWGSSLLSEPTILLLDEPTNNLDERGIEWLESFIDEFKGSIVVVSHDRHLINRTIDIIWEIDFNTKGIQVFNGNYDYFLKEKRRLYDKRMAEHENKARKIKETEKWLRVHEFHPKYRFSSIIGSKKQKLLRLKDNQAERPVGDSQIKLNDIQAKKQGCVLSVDIKSKSFIERLVFENIFFKVYKDERVLVRGENGSGKTTLLNMIIRKDVDFEGEILVGERARVSCLRQVSDLDKSKNILEIFEKETGVVEPKSRSILARYLFDAQKVIQPIGALSYGQLRRLDLAIILTQKPSLLILDEPTNHLDIYTREILESFIVTQKIPMIIVSHDKYFIEKIKPCKVVEL